MFDVLPPGFDLNDVLFYSAFALAAGYAALFAGARRSRRAALEGGWLDLEAAALGLEDETATPRADRVR